MTNRLLVHKKKRPKSKWMVSFLIPPALTDIELVTSDRKELCRNIRNKRIQKTEGR